MILDDITKDVAARLTADKNAVSQEEMKNMALASPKQKNFPFEHAVRQPGISFICEVKRASPSKGVIAEDFPYAEIAKEYEAAGAAAISVLTERDHFQGCAAYLQEIAKESGIPVLRKDFIIDEYQIYEARYLGASAVLLICSVLDDERLRRFMMLADELGLSALVETHDENEVQRALRCGARIIGVNNRNLKDFTVSLDTSCRLRSLVPADKIFIAESGIRSREDVEKLEKVCVDAVLIGETLMRRPDKKAALAELAGGVHDSH